MEWRGETDAFYLWMSRMLRSTRSGVARRFATPFALIAPAVFAFGCDATPTAPPASDAATVAPFDGSAGVENKAILIDSRFAERVQTPAGIVTVEQVPPLSAVVKLGTETVYPPTCPRGGPNCGRIKAIRDGDEFGSVRIISRVHVRGGADAALLMQELMQGNACNGTSIWFTKFKADGSYVFSEPIDYCGGPDPSVTVRGSLVVVSVPAHPPNRGTGTIAGFDSTYDLSTGALRAVH